MLVVAEVVVEALPQEEEVVDKVSGEGQVVVVPLEAVVRDSTVVAAPAEQVVVAPEEDTKAVAISWSAGVPVGDKRGVAAFWSAEGSVGQKTAEVVVEVVVVVEVASQ